MQLSPLIMQEDIVFNYLKEQIIVFIEFPSHMNMFSPVSPFCVTMLTLNWCDVKIQSDTNDLL